MQSTNELPRVSVLVPCLNEARFIEACIDSILDGDYPNDRIEVLVVDGRSDDGTRAIVERIAERDPRVRLLDNPRRITPAALNTGIRAAKGEVIVRMDAHLVYPAEYIRELVTALIESDADNVGGILRTIPANDSPSARAIAVGMAHPFGVGNSRFRIGTKTPQYVDTIAFFCCRRELFDRVGYFDEELVRHQDGEFNARLIAHGGKILLTPKAHCYYYGRETLRQLGRMFYQYGYFKPRVAKKIGRIMTTRQLAPPVFVLALGIGSLLAPFSSLARLGLALVLGSYLSVTVFQAVRALPRLGARSSLTLAAVFPVLHLSYGAGFLRSLLELAFARERRPASARAFPISR